MFDTVEAPRIFTEATNLATFTDKDGDKVSVAPYSDYEAGNVVRIVVNRDAEVWLTPAQVLHFTEVLHKAALAAEIANLTQGKPTQTIAKEDAYTVE